jgi:hypothetical protein
MDDIFRITKDANGQPVYTYNNEVVSKDVFDQKNVQSLAEQKEMRKPDAFDSQFDDMREKALSLKKQPKKASGGSIDLSKCKVNTTKKNSSSSNW